MAYHYIERNVPRGTRGNAPRFAYDKGPSALGLDRNAPFPQRQHCLHQAKNTYCAGHCLPPPGSEFRRRGG